MLRLWSAGCAAQFGAREGIAVPLADATEVQANITRLRAELAELEQSTGQSAGRTTATALDPFARRVLAREEGYTAPVVVSFHSTKMRDTNNIDAGLDEVDVGLDGVGPGGNNGAIISNAMCQTVTGGVTLEGEEDTEWHAGHRHQHATFAAGPEDCCVICSLEPTCKGWTFSMDATVLYHLDDLPPGGTTSYKAPGPNKAGCCHLFSRITGTKECASAECVSGYQGQLKVAVPASVAMASSAPSYAVVMRSVVGNMPMRHILLWGQQLQAVGIDFWVMTDVSSCEEADSQCKALTTEQELTAHLTNVKHWPYTAALFDTWAAGHGHKYTRDEPNINFGWPSLSLVYWASHLEQVPEFTWLLEVTTQLHCACRPHSV
jgi:hypothetical protein